MTKDLYPNHSLEEIINDLDKNDRKRLAKQNYPTDGVIVKSDLAYIDYGDDFHLFDIYYNEENKGKGLPTIINIHGGGLVYGRKELNRNINIEFARSGFNVAALNYRLIPQVSLKKQIYDIISGISFIYNNHEKFDLNMDKLFISADSAGAYLAMAAFAIINSSDLQNLFGIFSPRIEIDGMVFISPMTRLADDGSFSTINNFVIDSLDHDELKSYAKNMINILDKVNPCPIFIQTSKEDFIRDHSYDLRDYLDERGAFYEFTDFGKGSDQALGHVFPVCYPKWPESDMAIGQMILFLKNLGGFMRKLYIVRHGQTLFNLKGMTQGWCDSPLTDLGIRQARKVGEYFKENNIKFDEAYSSTQERACDTLELITDIPYKRVKDLKEWNFGMMEGEAEILQKVPRRPDQMTHEDFFVPWGGESDKEVAARMSRTIKEILEKSTANTILMVSHAGAMWTHVLSTLDNPQRDKPGHLGNCAILEYDVDDANKLKFIKIHEPAKDVK